MKKDNWKPKPYDTCTVIEVYKNGEALELEFIDKSFNSHLLTVSIKKKEREALEIWKEN